MSPFRSWIWAGITFDSPEELQSPPLSRYRCLWTAVSPSSFFSMIFFEFFLRALKAILHSLGDCKYILGVATLGLQVMRALIGYAVVSKIDRLYSYRVGSGNFSQRKTGHAHDNSADSEYVAGAREPNVHAHFIFHFKIGQGNQSFFLSMTKIQLKRFNHKLSRWTIDAPSTGRFREGSSGQEKSLGQHGFVEKKANFVDSSKLLLRGSFKETKHDRFGKKPAATEAKVIDDRSTEADVNALRRSIEVFFFSFFFFYDRLTTLDLCFLLWK